MSDRDTNAGADHGSTVSAPALSTVLVNVEDLNAAIYNPRRLSEKAHAELRESILRFGLVEPLVVNSNSDRFNVVVGGHQRLTVASELGYTQVPVFYMHLSEERERELNLRLNKNVGDWDWEKLVAEFGTGLLTEVGFTMDELGPFLSPIAPDAMPTDTGEEWKEMPEFDQPSAKPFRTVLVHFMSQEAVDEFGELVGQPMTNRFIYYPPVEPDRVAGIGYAEVPAPPAESDE